ncbi:MAG: methyltransferase FkbM family [Bryobacterales bacterium]|nr:methyltransferase FkbM family [Bryobacterales bacterium]
MYSSAGVLTLSRWDTARWLWSYYASRLPEFCSGWAASVQITVGEKEDRATRLMIRKNGFDWDTVDEIFVQNIYRANLESVRRVLDLGGNIGLAALYFARTYPDAHICTVEPIPENVAVLERNVELNHAPVHVVRAAAGAQDGKIRFELSEDPRAHSSVGSKGLANPKTFEANVLSVPSLMQLIGWEECDLLKIDIEGGEVEVLGGHPPWLKKVRNIIGEGHAGSGYTIEVCRRDLEPMGFEVELLRESTGSFLFLARCSG